MSGAEKRKVREINSAIASGQLSRREFLIRSGCGIAALASLAGCAPDAPIAPAPTQAAGVTVTTNPGAGPGGSLDAKIGQMILIGFRGLELTEDNPVVQDLRERHIGGVVLFDYDSPSRSPVRNIQSPAQVKALCASLQRTAGTRLLIAIDQEGGIVSRLKEKFGFPPSVSEQYLGTQDDLNLTRQYAETTAKTLADLGININFAPVVDLNTNPRNPIIGSIERSFSADPAVVTRHALQMIEADHKQGVLATLKHFPGHGSSQSDSHLGMVDVTETWAPAELAPYREIIQAGQCDAVMTAHIFNRKLDPDLPATLSKLILTGILREQLEYDGVIISDDMQMKAIADHYGFGSAIQQAIQAGVDILAIANNSIFDEKVAEKTIAVIKKLVEQGRITPERIEQSYQRIVRIKARLN